MAPIDLKACALTQTHDTKIDKDKSPTMNLNKNQNLLLLSPGQGLESNDNSVNNESDLTGGDVSSDENGMLILNSKNIIVDEQISSPSVSASSLSPLTDVNNSSNR